jgi:hypothetical protein
LEDRQNFYKHPKKEKIEYKRTRKFRDIEHIISESEFITQFSKKKKSTIAMISCYYDGYSKRILLVINYDAKSETLMLSLKSINMKRFNKWIFLKNFKREIIDNIHLKNGMFVYDRQYKEIEKMDKILAAKLIQRKFRRHKK